MDIDQNNPNQQTGTPQPEATTPPPAQTTNPYEQQAAPQQVQGTNPYAQQTQQPVQTDENGNPVTLNYAGFGVRAVAAFIDGIIMGVVGFVLGFGTMMVMQDESAVSIANGLGQIISAVYFVYFTAAQGATLGKKAMGLRVQNIDTGQNLNYVQAFLREVVGKFISGIVIGLGYFWVIWDPQKQGWHDKIASSVVVKTK